MYLVRGTTVRLTNLLIVLRNTGLVLGPHQESLHGD